MELGLRGRRAVITGASKGIGFAVAEELAREGVGVAICARHNDEVEHAAGQLREHGVPVYAETADVTKVADVNGFIAAAASALGGVDILVNNAGAAHPGTFATLTDEDWQQDLDIKLFAQIRCTRAAMPHLRRSVAGRIININAVYAKSPHPAFFATTVDRAACLNLNKALAMELGVDGILVNSVNIGLVATPQWESIRALRAPELTEQDFYQQISSEEVPLKRFGAVSEVSGVVAFLASDRASYITGASVDVAGGMGRHV